MNGFNRFLWRLFCGSVLGFLSPGVQAGFAEITAQFRPDPANTMINRFKNTTPNSGYCAHFHVFCNSNGLFSLSLPLGPLPQTTGGPIQARHTDPRRGAFLKVPSEWRRVSIADDKGNSAEVEIRISGIGGRHDIGSYVDVITGGGSWEELWSSGRWHKAPPPCTSTGGLTGTGYYIIWFWMVPENAGACATQALFDIPLFDYRYIHFGYELRTPNPLNMPAGIYRGRQIYTVGPGGDFDFGDLIVPHDTVVNLDFELDVDHILKVEVPAGGNRVQLEPQGGWQGWVTNGRKPTRLFRDQTVNLWASSQFKMNLECGQPMGNTCSVSNAAGHQVPLDIAVTLPSGLTDAVGRPVNRLPLRLDGVGTERFQPSRYIDRKPSTLHFEIKAEGVSHMLDQNSGSPYTGTATVTWDSEV